MTSLSGTFELASWDEQPYLEIDDQRKITRATVTQKFTGDLIGKGSVEWLMCYAADGTARFVGMQRIETDDGSCVLESVGDFDGELAKGNWTIVEGSGTGNLSTAHGTGTFEAEHGPTASWSLNTSD